MKKKLFGFIIIVLMLLVGSQAFATVYYVDKTTGNDADTGLTEELAWETLAKVATFAQATEFTSDDQILLKCGETWAETLYLYGTGTSGHHVIYGAYGEGVDPIISRIYHRNYMHGNVTGDNEYITIQNMRITNGAGSGVDTSTINYITLQNLYVYSCTNAGIEIDTEVAALTDWTIQDVETTGNTGYGLVISCRINNLLLERVNTNLNGFDGMNMNHGTNVVVTACIAHDNTQDGFDIQCGIGGLTATYQYCRAYDNVSAGFSAKATVGSTATYQSCISYGNNEGWEVGNNSNAIIYNSVAYDNDLIGIYLFNDDTHILKNNIIFYNGETPAASGFQVSYLMVGQTLTADNNYYGVHSLGRSIYVNKDAVFKTFAEWQAYEANAYDQSGGSGDPLFTNAAGDDFTLQKGSPAIDVGADLGATYDDGLSPISVWPDAVTTLDQDDHGDGWEIGAYVFIPGSLIPMIMNYRKRLRR